MARKILCVAEKPSIAKSVAQHLSGGQMSTVGQHSILYIQFLGSGCSKRSITGNPYVKNYDFDFNFGPPWGNCSVTMTSVVGHLNELRFPAQYKQWHNPPPSSLFDAPVEDVVNPVCFLLVGLTSQSQTSLGQDSYCRQYRTTSPIFWSSFHLD